MKCPKCGYISFDFNDKCPKCSRDLTEMRSKLILFPFKPSPINWLESEEEEVLTSAPGAVSGEIAGEEVSAGEEIELETVSLDSLDIGEEEGEEKTSEMEMEEEKTEGVEREEEEKEIEIEPVDLKSLEEEMEKREKEKKKEDVQEEKEEKKVELEPIDLDSLEIELEEDKDNKK